MELFSRKPAAGTSSESAAGAGRLADSARMVIVAVAVCTVLSALLAVSLM